MNKTKQEGISRGLISKTKNAAWTSC